MSATAVYKTFPTKAKRMAEAKKKVAEMRSFLESFEDRASLDLYFSKFTPPQVAYLETLVPPRLRAN